ncbi:HNH endonuclease [Vallitalea okinawensis]|uniref:HNH endonuclease n=1 Tax=Vallitalea okinawensis TaxID=2078660 RepID=UPI000CFB2A99|nr:HNH endonuclease domain-containing protein [Vallitalea okinawensis]
MNSTFLSSWYDILRNCNYDNTYKMAWAKAIVEIALEADYSNICETYEISLEAIAHKVIKYYWNQIIFFNLIQGSNPLRPPKILTLTKVLIDKYQSLETKQPIRFEKIQHVLVNDIALNKHFRSTIKKITTVLKADVSYRFLNLGGKKLEDIYQYEKGDASLFIQAKDLKTLKDNALQIFDTINYRWSLILETFNSTPRICKKVRIIDDVKIRRKPLNQYMKYLDMYNPNHICFICDTKIEKGLLSIDHVIPWSYLYSDDLWNLVYAHRGCNSMKNNIIPNENSIRKLEERNKELLQTFTNHKRNKVVQELQLAVDNNYVQKFWIACQS